jgi:hypothetical protein
MASGIVEVAQGTVGTLNVYLRAPREWDHSEVNAAEIYGRLVGSLLGSALAAKLKGAAHRAAPVGPRAPHADRAGQARADGSRGHLGGRRLPAHPVGGAVLAPAGG